MGVLVGESNSSKLAKQKTLELGSRFIDKFSMFHFMFLICILLIRAGIGFAEENIKVAFIPASIALPEPTGYFSASLGNLALAKFFGIDSLFGWKILHSLILVFVFIVIYRISRDNWYNEPSIFTLIIFFSSAPIILVQGIGNYDPVTFLGAILMVAHKNLHYSILGAVVMSLGNPEQAVAASMCILVLSFSSEFLEWRKYAVAVSLVSSLQLAIIQIWMLSNGELSNRVTNLPYFLAMSLRNFSSDIFGNVYSWFGILWIPIVYLLLVSSMRSRFFMTIALILIPGSLSVITADSFRVASIVSLPVLLLIFGEKSYRFSTQEIRTLVGLGLITWFVVPPFSPPTYGAAFSSWAYERLVDLEKVTLEIANQFNK